MTSVNRSADNSGRGRGRGGVSTAAAGGRGVGRGRGRGRGRDALVATATTAAHHATHLTSTVSSQPPTPAIGEAIAASQPLPQHHSRHSLLLVRS